MLDLTYDEKNNCYILEFPHGSRYVGCGYNLEEARKSLFHLINEEIERNINSKLSVPLVDKGV